MNVYMYVHDMMLIKKDEREASLQSSNLMINYANG